MNEAISCKRLVVKVGSALIAPHRTGCLSHYLLHIAHFIVQCRSQGIEVVLVSSGAVAAGAHLFNEKQKPSVKVKKAMAAAGQMDMMATWDRLFDFPSAQVLVTNHDLQHRERFVSVRETLFTLLEEQILPIINENDTITCEQNRVGDNDNLAAMVAAAVNADALLICSDVDGLFDKNPSQFDDASLVAEVKVIDARIRAMAGGAVETGVGTGGMSTKVQAAEKATSFGIDTYILNGFSADAFQRFLQGENPGTHFAAFERPLQDKIHWLKHTAKALGEITLDGSSLTATDDASHSNCAAVSEVKGRFSSGDMVLVRDSNGRPIMKAQTNYSSCLLNFIVSQSDQQLVSQVEKFNGPLFVKEQLAMLEKV